MSAIVSILHVLLALTLSPLIFGVINRTKALFAGRRGQPLLQTYYDLAKLLRKGAVYSRTTGPIFRASPVVGVAASLVALCIVPLGGVRGLLAFPGDFVVLVYALGLMRFMTVLAALDTGSAFEGMGASREVQFSLLAEPALLLGLAVLASSTGTANLSDMVAMLYAGDVERVAPAVVMVAVSLFIVLLAENARIPVDDPNTHLELTMIHEVMVLDHGSVDFAFIRYAASLKAWVFAALLAGIALPLRSPQPLLNLLAGLGVIVLVSMLVGIVESTMARLRLVRVPQLLVVAMVLTVVAWIWLLR